jgi:hypothetical protein
MFLQGLAIIGVHIKKINPQFFQQRSKMIRSKQQDYTNVPYSESLQGKGNALIN